MERNTIGNILEKIQLYVISFAIFYSTIIYLPTIQNGYNFPKLFIIYCGAFIAIGIEAIKILYLRKKLYFQYTDLFIISFLLSNALTLMFSFNQSVSFWGEYQSEGLDFFSILSYISLLWVASRSSKPSLDTIKLFYIGGTYLASLFALYKYFSTHIRPYGLEGQPIMSAGIIALGLVLSLQYIFTCRRYILLVLASIHIAALYVLDSSTVIVTILGAIVLYIFLLVTIRSKSKRIWYVIIVSLCLIAAVVVSSKLIPKESFSLHRRIAQYEGIQKILQSSMTLKQSNIKNIVFGLGQYGSGYAFKQYRSRTLNESNEWNWELVRIQNHYLEIFITSGAVGFFIWILPFIVALIYIYRTRQYLSALPILYVICWQFLYYLQPVMIAVALLSTITLIPRNFLVPEKKRFHLYASKLLALYFVILSIWGLYTSINLFRAEHALANDQYEQALTLAPQNAEYMRQTAQNYILLVDMVKKSYPCLWNKSCNSLTTHNLYENGKRYADKSIHMNPYRGINWYTYNVLVFHQYLDELPKDKKKAEFALQLIEKAHTLDPSNPEYVDSKGQIYLDMQQYELAEKYFKQAIDLKHDFIQSYRHLREVYFQTHQMKKTQQMEEKIKQLLSP